MFSTQMAGIRTCGLMGRSTTATTTSHEGRGKKMSVILESQAGDEVVCIEPFSASPDGTTPSAQTNREFRVGERVRYVSFRQDQHYKDHPGLGWMVLFEAADGKQYAATQTYFVTEECWHGLIRFFAKRLFRESRRRKASRP
jgi:hypothetical protein